MKIAIACGLFLALVAMPAHAGDEHASQPGPALTASNATSAAIPAPGPATLPAASPSAPSLAPVPVFSAAPAGPALEAAAPMNALPAAPSAFITLKKPHLVEHGFFNLTNSLALGAMAAGLTADALSTQKGLSYPGFYEVNPLARPFMQSRAGAAVYSAGSFGLLAGGMYLAHRTHHHKLERVLPFAIAGWEGLLSARNYHVIDQHTK